MRKTIYVLSSGSLWKVKCEHCNEEIHRTQLDAIKTARAHVAGYPVGTLSQILVQRDNGSWREEWTYNKDPYPPIG